MIKRQLQDVIESRLFRGKAILVIGARQVGKSTLLSEIVGRTAESRVLALNCDEPEVKQLLSAASTSDLRLLIADRRIVLIDEAQRVPDIGMTLKRITDNFPDVQLLVTGSSAFELHSRLNEPLTGRKYEFRLYPISTGELMQHQGSDPTGGLLGVRSLLEMRLIYGSYPDVLTHASEAKELLMGLADSYLYKDILALDHVRKPALVEKLLIALALQVGSEVSTNELAQTIGSDTKTVDRYIDLLEKCYIVFRLPALSRNLRTELKKGKKIYFYDNGIRNAVLQNFAPIGLRSDMGALWENFFISERLKANHYAGRFVRSYFWRTTTQQEIDYVEEEDGAFTAFEMKWNPRRTAVSLPAAFGKNYPLKASAVITPDSYLEWLT